TKVSFNGVSANFTVVTDTYMTAKVPSGATKGAVTVLDGSGTLLTSSKIFVVVPNLISFNPTSGPVSSSVVLTGTGLTQAAKVTFGGVNATVFTVNSDSQITASVPTGAKTGKIAVTTPGGTSASSATFTVTP
ncbi:MAG TPA: IPT/TIG domain-containing protein, partial [Candidatus Acidoferrum sp.]|nr:IPT/TIG domain-containing protein [Candidatus Acidoferrum sp.]